MSLGSEGFRRLLWANLLRAAHEYPEHNWDWRFFGKQEQRSFDLNQAVARMDHMVQTIPDLEWLFDTLGDDHSRRVLIKRLMMGILGPLHVQMPLNTPEFRQTYESIDDRFLMEREALRMGKRKLDRYRVQACGRPIHLNIRALGILNTFVLEQYAYRRDGVTVCAAPGDTVIDGGACWGDTALYFAAQTGQTGKVYSFEVADENVEVFNVNLGLNPWAKDQVSLCRKALFDSTDTTLQFTSIGPGTHLVKTAPGGADSATTVKIDDFAATNGVRRLDMIKMDIEGSEPAALRGAREIIARDKPKLAISVYHQPEDLTDIPRIIRSIDPNYRLYLDHFTMHSHETVLFAHVPDRPQH